ncbi:peptide-binding protein [Roseivivax halodurans JCM 10272]|uniref:Peptide-binding protein n=1 Tax=Roseivivax halodurans JCM 10272 TaxID=1449350 RepID=X7EHB9_9RHOB|nr:SH3 domain-containing protein [Roseivivax halodurans]ETX15317.1 peptide-binding protein [Roseivivax halodurans JCM 10272]
MIRSLAVLLVAAGPALSQESLPALHSVIGVAADDVLNVRTAPEASAEKIGELGPEATGVEVIAVQDGWGRVNTGERSGWASLDFLEAEPGGRLPDVTEFSCFGTEPFWSLDVAAGGTSTFSEPEGEATWLTGPVRSAEGVPGRFFAVVGGAAGGTLALAISAEECGDGMSDRQYGLSAALITTGEGARTLSGCCSLSE